jgi:hypothetical protein
VCGRYHHVARKCEVSFSEEEEFRKSLQDTDGGDAIPRLNIERESEV